MREKGRERDREREREGVGGMEGKGEAGRKEGLEKQR